MSPEFLLRCVRPTEPGNLSACGWIDRKKTIGQIDCSVCEARFSERKGMPLYNSKLPTDNGIALLDHVHEGCAYLSPGQD